MDINKLKEVKNTLKNVIEVLETFEFDTRQIKLQVEDLEEYIESKSFRPINKLKKMKRKGLNDNQKVVLNELKKTDDGFVISTIVKFSDYHTEDSDIENAFTSLSAREELEIVENYCKYLRGAK